MPDMDDADVTEDRFLDGAFAVLQPRRRGHRAGLDALLLAASVPAGSEGLLVDLGAGVGTAGLAAAVRSPGLTVRLVERDPATTELARRGLALAANQPIADRVQVIEADVTAAQAVRVAAGLMPASADWVILNPPFHAAGGMRVSPDAARAAAHVLAEGDLDRWIRTAVWLLKPGGRIAVVFRGDAVVELVSALEGRFGAVTVHPVVPRAGEPAHRLVVTGIKGRKAATVLMAGLVLHPANGSSYLPEADEILRGRAGLPGGRV